MKKTVKRPGKGIQKRKLFWLKPRNTQLIVALDVDSLSRAKKLVDLLYPKVEIFKVGLQLFLAAGEEIISYINKKGGKVFLDLKFHDIPNTVSLACREAVRMGVFMFNVHAQGGRDMMKQAREAAALQAKRLRKDMPIVVGVTVLTSQQNIDTTVKVLGLARDVKEAGLHGVVCSVHEADIIRRGFGEDFIIATPGIRPAGCAMHDQKRTATPEQAKAAGADYIVVGRPIIEADKPLKLANDILKAIQ